MKNIKIVLLVGKGNSSHIVYNELKQYFNILGIIEEKKVPTLHFIRKRLKKLGWITVIGQFFFFVYLRFLKIMAKSRINQIVFQYNLSTIPYPKKLTFNVNSVNDPLVKDKLLEWKPHIVIVNGTRIIDENILSSVPMHFINTHVGITPRYRGVHGAYWALAEENPTQCGVTVHLVDKGIDTGGILYQSPIIVMHKDNFLTYPYIQLAFALPLLRQAIIDIYTNSHKIVHNGLTSKFYTHPTLFGYLKKYFTAGIK